MPKPKQEFAKLDILHPREAWKHEAHDFTVWLADNLHRLAEPTGMTLELVQTEMLVGDFKADIIARDAQASPEADRMLIENQLETSDHRHLGQILTYLAGAEISAAIWIATQFRDEHLSAVKWLNERTDDSFAFFAVQLRTVRIENSPIAPLFEVLARPNTWERQVKAASPRSSGLTDEGQSNGRFWDAYLSTHPGDLNLGMRQWFARHQYIEVLPGISISIWASLVNAGVFVCASEHANADQVYKRLLPHLDALRDQLGFSADREGKLFLLKRYPVGHKNESDWPELIEWLHGEAHAYAAALRDVVGEDEDN